MKNALQRPYYLSAECASPGGLLFHRVNFPMKQEYAVSVCLMTAPYSAARALCPRAARQLPLLDELGVWLAAGGDSHRAAVLL